MALIGKETRDLIHQQSEVPGPGIYNLSFNIENPISYAPFNSLNPRFPKSSNQKQLGPGDYQIHSTIGCPSFIKFENERNIIIKINDFGSSVFRSRSNRFNQTPLRSTPGVGEYEINQKKQKKPKKRVPCKSADHPVLRIIKQQNKKDQKRIQEKYPKVVQLEEKQIKSVGPGSYHWQQSTKKATPGSVWSLSKVQRFSDDAKQELHDASLVMDQIRRQRQKQRESSQKPSSFFKSQTVKSYFDQLTYQTNSSVKLSIRKQLNYKSQSPAPGSYNINPANNDNNVFQFFGSTEQRFKDNTQSMVGPGEYFIPSGFKLKFTKPVADLTKRTDFQLNNWMPGPGYYEIPNSFIKKKRNQSIQQFGSLQPRFKTQQHIKSTENQDQSNFNLNNQNIVSDVSFKNQSKIVPKSRSQDRKKMSSFFKSQSKKVPKSSESNTTPFAQYDVQKFDIGRVAQTDKNYLYQLQQSNLKRPPFNSGTLRFKSLQTPSNRNLFDLNIPRLYDNSNQPNGQSSAFRSTTVRRFMGNPQAPGVGSYALGGSMIKDTFNRKYSNKPCGVKNRFKIISNPKRMK